MITRLWCRLVGHDWVFMPGITHGHDSLFECSRCGSYDWRDGASPDERTTPRP